MVDLSKPHVKELQLFFHVIPFFFGYNISSIEVLYTYNTSQGPNWQAARTSLTRSPAASGFGLANFALKRSTLPSCRKSFTKSCKVGPRWGHGRRFWILCLNRNGEDPMEIRWTLMKHPNERTHVSGSSLDPRFETVWDSKGIREPQNCGLQYCNVGY